VRVRVHLFARYREVAGREQVDLELPEGGTVETAWSAVVDRHPALAQYRPYTLFAVGHDYVENDHPLKPGDDLCLFPPVSGGSSGSASRSRRRGEPVNEAVRAAAAGEASL
jgi:molybdopterin converting factor small subunit